MLRKTLGLLLMTPAASLLMLAYLAPTPHTQGEALISFAASASFWLGIVGGYLFFGRDK